MASRAVSYPRKSDIQRAVETARSLGIEVAGYEITPNGGIRVFDRNETRDEFERWEQHL